MPKTNNGGAGSGTDSGDDVTPDRDTRWQQVAKRLYDPDQDDALTSVIVFAIADAEGVAPTEVDAPTLYNVVDVAAIEGALFGARPDGTARETTGSVEFRYAEYLVEVNSGGWVRVCEPTDPEPR
ncbi:HalOD1 output domain-containing protein [Halorubrum kocurii]|uniref:Halobacterial output domain-containing protein n=1 Tax=Halorubrum kocurii JCM 14978 TaxID=1230456 RepID=M0NJC0_9EURY|nr:HalOD1 output domain-containing protein [Halorubrum kocurii]EMA57648.1 hypothetical protein C468_16697 [Halorubrum kocurii JCM 14978]